MHLKQEKSYGCGLYSVANALQIKRFVTKRRISLSKDGNFIGQLNRWLLKDKIMCWISVVIYNNDNPIEIFDLQPKSDDCNKEWWTPFFITIKCGNKFNHMIGCRYMFDGKIVEHDSIKNEEEIFDNFESFKRKYEGKILSFEILINYRDNKPILIYEL